MNCQEFHQQYPAPSPREVQLRKLAEHYVRECERYDRTVCTGPTGRDGILPATHHELALINRRALWLLTRLCQAIFPFATPAELRQAICKLEQQGYQP